MPFDADVHAPQGDTWLAARLAVELAITKEQANAALEKAKELADRGRPLGVGEIVIRMKWATPSEVRWINDPNHPPADLLPDIRLLKLLGSGGMSRVYAATDLRTGRSVAVKLMNASMRRSATLMERYRAEVEVSCSVVHENLVETYYDFEFDGLHYLVMERLDGESTRSRIDAGGCFNEVEVLEMALSTARALKALSDAGWVHRDVKPSNIIKLKSGRYKLVDLGLAVRVGAGEGDVTAGTVSYLAPEQAEGTHLDSRADMYALGATMYQWLFGKLPFDVTTSDDEQLAARIAHDLRSGDLKAAAVSHQMDFLVRKMMARNRDMRFATWNDLIARIEGMLPPSTSRRPTTRRG